MTEDEREKFDAIRMTLELTGHDLEGMRERVEKLSAACEATRFACEANRLAIEEQAARSFRDFEDVRESIRSIALSTDQLLKVSRGHQSRLEVLEKSSK
jgi:hypothetical protein